MKIYPVIYSDKNGKIEGVLENLYSEDKHLDSGLILKLGQYVFEGYWMHCFDLINAQSYHVDELERFSFTLYKHDESIIELSFVQDIESESVLTEFTKTTPRSHSIELANFKLEIKIPINIVETSSKNELTIDTTLLVNCETSPLGKGKSLFNLQLYFNDKNLKFSEDGFDNLFYLIERELKGEYYLKNCFGCKFSEYNPYGNPGFGEIKCNKHIKDKEECNHGNPDLLITQELYCCEAFEQKT